MRSINRKRALIVAAAIILLSMTIITGMTWALFTDTQNVTNHLQAGDLKITLKRTELTKTTLNSQGFLVTEPTDKTVVTFSNPTDNKQNVFGIETVNGKVTEKVVPGSKFVATMQIENNSDVAFNYWVRIDCKNEDVKKALASQLQVVVYTDKNKDGKIITENVDIDQDGVVDIYKESSESYVSSDLEVGNDKKPIGTLAIGQSEKFIVSVEFVDLGYSYVNGVLTSSNDPAQLDNVEFDLVVYAIQATTATTTK